MGNGGGRETIESKWCRSVDRERNLSMKADDDILYYSIERGGFPDLPGATWK